MTDLLVNLAPIAPTANNTTVPNIILVIIAGTPTSQKNGNMGISEQAIKETNPVMDAPIADFQPDSGSLLVYSPLDIDRAPDTANISEVTKTI
jgi:hypothetical protein